MDAAVVVAAADDATVASADVDTAADADAAAAAGPQYRLLAAVLWGPICGGAHLLNDLIHPRFILEDWLISEGLLDPRVRGECGQVRR